MLQYMAKLDCQKLYHVVRDFTGGLKKYYNFHVAPGIESEQLTGFLHNGVSPFGTLTSIPVIIDKGIASLKPAFFYFGGGDIDTKLGCSVEEFLQKTGARVADVANPRDGDYEGKDTKLDDDEDDDEDDVCEKESIEEK
ncbi:putative Serine/threonine-protein phosphatase 6 regulatory ankyrin repeat subunit C [Monocercomonoides exilis]|uniref:putative Serine/threonine-protein phosphatase 6 regulatory ankyrin repeat subunit C n=1 Tax=Monocercomonoides exilis TaxID=2049356 RepID=UPI003559E8CF|nr:putative Serine/threonine-protein phosphatase 6 regulatory ankyrin repeat subunit C [Monocercomonoides exilis]